MFEPTSKLEVPACLGSLVLHVLVNSFHEASCYLSVYVISHTPFTSPLPFMIPLYSQMSNSDLPPILFTYLKKFPGSASHATTLLFK